LPQGCPTPGRHLRECPAEAIGLFSPLTDALAVIQSIGFAHRRAILAEVGP
jgi:hypothetical protein